MTSPRPTQPPDAQAPETLSNWLALLALLAIGIVWPFAGG